MVLDLGSGTLKLKAAHRRVDDGQPHQVSVKQFGVNGVVRVDDDERRYVVAGLDGPSTLDLEDRLYVGGLATRWLEHASCLPVDLEDGLYVSSGRSFHPRPRGSPVRRWTGHPVAGARLIPTGGPLDRCLASRFRRLYKRSGGRLCPCELGQDGPGSGSNWTDGSLPGATHIAVC